MDVLKINGKAVKNPMTLEFQIYDLDSEDGSGRNQNGDMFRDRKAIKRKIVCNFPPMNDSEISELLESVEPVFFELEYPDARLGKRNTINAYVGDRTMPIYLYDKYLEKWIWQGLSVNFIEK